MTKTEDYIPKLRILYDEYTGKQLEQALGVTTKSIQNYLKPVKPQIPGKEIVQRIEEAFAKHKEAGKIERDELQVANGGILNVAIADLAAATKKHAETDAVNARNIERLIALLEAKPTGVGLAEPGTPGRMSIGKKKPA